MIFAQHHEEGIHFQVQMTHSIEVGCEEAAGESE